jgi:hypothetical protein
VFRNQVVFERELRRAKRWMMPHSPSVSFCFPAHRRLEIPAALNWRTIARHWTFRQLPYLYGFWPFDQFHSTTAGSKLAAFAIEKPSPLREDL